MRKVFLIAGFVVAIQGKAQNNNSPYSMIGIGDLEKSSFDRTSGMGYAGLAISSNRYMYNDNPASFARLDEHFFHFEVTTRFKSVNYYGDPITDLGQSGSNDLQVKKLAMAIKIRPKWAVSFGLMPYSTSNYSFAGQKNMYGTDITAKAYYEGSGGLNQFYLTNSVELGKHFSIGLQAAYLYGQLKQTETLAMDGTDSTLTTARNMYIGKPYLKIGAQYKTKLSSSLDIAVGAVASNQLSLQSDYGLVVLNGSSVLLSNEFYKTSYFTVPANYGAGIAATVRDKYTFALDYHYEGWDKLAQKGLSYSLVNSQRISAGTEYSKKISYNGVKFEKYFLQGGFFYEDSYLKIYGQQISNYGITLGAGGMLNGSGLGWHTALEIGARGTTDNGLIKEKYTQISFTLSYRDFWFTKMKKYD